MVIGLHINELHSIRDEVSDVQVALLEASQLQWGRGMTYCPLDLVENYLRRFVAYPSEHALVAHVLWIAHCHMFERFDTTPRARLHVGREGIGQEPRA